MEKIITKKLFAGILAVSAGCLLASCDPIEAVPANYTEPLIQTKTGEKVDFEDNILGTIYDLIESDSNSKVVEKVLKTITDKQFGTFADFQSGNFKTKDYFKNAKSEYKLEHFEITVNERISEFFYNEVVSGSYNDEKGMFSEEKLYNAHRQELYELHELDKTVTEDKEVIDNKFYVTSTLDKKSLFKKPSKGLIRQDRVLKGNYNDYIEKKIYPQILKDILVEDYIYRNNPISLGRSYATKVSYVKVAYDEDSQIPVRRLLKNFANTHVEQGEIDFEIISEAIKGFKDFDEFGVHTISDKAKTLLDATYGENDTICVEEDVNYQGQPLLASGQPFHKNSKIGELIESFNKAIKAEKAGRFPIEEDKAELDKFTTDGKSKEYGLMQKLIALAKEDYTTDGWFVKSSGAGELPSNITDRLFNIKVSQDIDKIPEEKDGPNEEYKTSYLRNVKGNKFVIAKDADKYENDQLNYIYDDGSSACWMAVVSEAVSPAKFNEKAETWLGKKENEHGTENRLEKIGRSVAEVLGTKSNYVKETYTEYLNEYKDFMFYDSALYDYFKSEYPDLDIFDEE